ncbi:SDR family NAD(P)-dependent oxidoreductase [Periweissella cryptocerci]|uniref:SDR family NAD(P)-dependent oxidoreductase n=1 Tax=Periweissella cryptocerci TaxID=2506420 RepID=A0A4V1AIU4_9LACO|nr:SDR family NAD(P)-dependent oxidoreductase [Periweissella cryptocerci]QBO36715.1 SDR family NAD(P)-dependent oxidoreductase [Periweissella cryptocerci]
MKNVIITGVSSGVGADTAKAFAQQGYQVYGLARRATSQNELAALGVKLVDVDLADEIQIEQFVATVTEVQTIDVLVNVAGFAVNGPIEVVPIATAEQIFQVNVFGALRLTRLLLPIMRQQQTGRIINISSILGETYQPLMGWYAASKHALEAVTDALRLEVQAFGIEVSLLQLSGVATPMTNGEPDFTAQNTVYEPLAQSMRKAFMQGWKYNLQPNAVAKFILQIAEARKPHARYARGFGAKLLIGSHRLLPTRVFDHVTLKMLRTMGK